MRTVTAWHWAVVKERTTDHAPVAHSFTERTPVIGGERRRGHRGPKAGTRDAGSGFHKGAHAGIAGHLNGVGLSAGVGGPRERCTPGYAGGAGFWPSSECGEHRGGERQALVAAGALAVRVKL